MTDETHDRHESPIDGAPVWVRALQAAVVGVAAGFVLHLLLSLVVVQGKELWSKPAAAPAACKKSRDAGTPSGRQAAPVGTVGAVITVALPGSRETGGGGEGGGHGS
jgi:hypothetical protein